MNESFIVSADVKLLLLPSRLPCDLLPNGRNTSATHQLGCREWSAALTGTLMLDHNRLRRLLGGLLHITKSLHYWVDALE
jgi:hypothetical protein